MTFAIDANGIVNVSAKDLATGRAQDITITATSNMSQSEIERAVREAEQYASEDAKIKATATAKDRCEYLLYQASSIKVDKSRKAELAGAVKAAKQAIRSKDTLAMNNAANDLEQLLKRCGCNVNSHPDDDVIDADFEEV